uniref:nucleolysin TIAR n=1 Tax=Lepeophtheirus salmonis TaxID=72036 RepID=UPI001AE95544|nr:nucleolysin TIA-1-like [Lepeophtheirus salmonis]
MNLECLEDGPRTLYVGNLDVAVTEDLVLALFGQLGAVKGCKIIREGASDPYCFVEFAHPASAAAALTAMNKRICLGKEMKVNWASSPGGSSDSVVHHNLPKPDTSQHHHIFVGDLSPDITTETLKNAFVPFGEISDCKVVKDMLTNKSKGYGFVSFVEKNDAQTAIEQMNGQWLGSRAIRTNWAARKPPAPYSKDTSNVNKLNFEDVYRQASPRNFTVYCGGLINSDENIIRQTFSPFGRILEIRYFRDKGYAFVRFDNKESACNAIVALHGSNVQGQSVKCSWGKESTETLGGGGGGGVVATPPAPQQPNANPQQQQQQYYQPYYMYNPHYITQMQQYYGQYGYCLNGEQN